MTTESIKGPLNLFYYNLNRLMHERGYSQFELADAMGRPRSSINLYANGKRFPGSDILQEFAEFFGVSPSDFLKTPEEIAASQQRALQDHKATMVGNTSDVQTALDGIEKFIKENGSSSFLLSVSSDAFYPYAVRGDVLQCTFAKHVSEGKMVLAVKSNAFFMGRIFPTESGYIIVSECKPSTSIVFKEKEWESTVVATVVACKHTF